MTSNDRTDITELADAQIRIAFETGYLRCLMRHADHLLHDAMITEADRAAERHLLDLKRIRAERIDGAGVFRKNP